MVQAGNETLLAFLQNEATSFTLVRSKMASKNKNPCADLVYPLSGLTRKQTTPNKTDRVRPYMPSWPPTGCPARMKVAVLPYARYKGTERYKDLDEEKAEIERFTGLPSTHYICLAVSNVHNHAVDDRRHSRPVPKEVKEHIDREVYWSAFGPLLHGMARLVNGLVAEVREWAPILEARWVNGEWDTEESQGAKEEEGPGTPKRPRLEMRSAEDVLWRECPSFRSKLYRFCRAVTNRLKKEGPAASQAALTQELSDNMEREASGQTTYSAGVEGTQERFAACVSALQGLVRSFIQLTQDFKGATLVPIDPIFT